MGQDLPFGRIVRDRRRALDLTQEELARRVGCAPVTVRKVEYGELRPSRQIAERLAVALAVSLPERETFIRAARALPPTQRGSGAPRTPQTAPSQPLSLDALVERGVRGYLLHEQLGAGGFGAVYRAVQPLVEREVAVKIILPQYADHPEFVRRFEAEARLVARLEHPHIVPLYDYWREPGAAFLVMRLLRGGSLHDLLAQGSLAPEHTLRLLEQIGAALEVAHRAGVVHRDLKPANILLDPEGNAYLADFGIAKDVTVPAGELSFAGAFVGSPAYSSPEQIRAEGVTTQTDLYALGLLAYELLSGRRPFPGPTPAAYIQQHLSASLPALAEHGLPPALDRTLQRATAKVPSARYPDVGQFIADLQRALSGSTARSAAPPRPQEPTAVATRVLELSEADNPYRGLRPFSEADAANFCGRESLVQQLLTRLGEPSELARFLAVVGPSGSGKSSAVHAGLIPALRAGGLPGSERWYVVDMVPGSEPLAALTRALLRVAPAGVEADDLLPLLAADHRGLLRAARRVLPHDDASDLLLLVDQFEELFTLVADPATQAHLLDSIVTATLDERSRVRVVVTLRADFIDRPLQYVDFGELLKQRSELVLPLTPDELEQAILGPARRAGLALEEGLTTALIAETLGQPGALPLLQHTLSELFARRQGRLLTLAAYRELGGVSGALARSADTIYAGLTETGQAAARQLFLRLVTPGEGVEDTRRRAKRSELDMVGAGEAITAYTTARLLTLDHDLRTRESTVEVAHEALIRGWPRLRAWLDTSREALRLQRQLARAAEEWAAAGDEASYLASGARLELFSALAKGEVVALSAAERDYLAASQGADARQRAETIARQREREAQRLSAEAALEVEQGDPVLGALLAIHVLRQGYNAQADGALVKAMGACLSWRSLTTDFLSDMAQGSLSPDGRRIAFGTASGFRIYDLASGAVVATGHQDGWLMDIRYAPDGRRLATAAASGLVALWDAETFERALALEHPGIVHSVAFAPDNRTLFTGCADGVARLWELETGAEILRLAGGGAPLYSVAFTPDGRQALTGDAEGTIIVWDVGAGTELRRLVGHTSWVNQIRFSPDGRLIATASRDRTARIWDAMTGAALRQLIGHEEHVSSASFSPDGRLIVTGGGDNTARIWDAATGYPLRIAYAHIVTDAFFTPDGRQIITAGGHGARIWPLPEAGEPMFLLGHTRGTWPPRFSGDGSIVATSSNDGTARIWESASGRELRRFDYAAAVGDLGLSLDGTTLVTACHDGNAYCYDLPTGRLLRVFEGIARFAPTVELLPNGRLVAICFENIGLTLWDVDSKTPRWTFRGAEKYVNGMCLSHDGARLLATTEPGGTLVVLDVDTGSLLFTGDVHCVRAVYLSDGSIIVSGDQGLHIVSGEDGSRLRTLTTNPTDEVYVSADGRYAAVGMGERNVGLWDLEQDVVLRQLSPPVTRNLGLSPDGRRIAVTEFSGTVRLYRADLDELIALAESQLQRGLTDEERARFGIAAL